jgi:hypothetical protein
VAATAAVVMAEGAAATDRSVRLLPDRQPDGTAGESGRIEILHVADRLHIEHGEQPILARIGDDGE